MSTRVEGGTVLIMVTAQATLSAGSSHLTLSVREGRAGDLALQSSRRHRQPYPVRARRRDGPLSGRAQVRRRHLRGRLPAGDDRKRPA
jgi:hypothetical protein